MVSDAIDAIAWDDPDRAGLSDATGDRERFRIENDQQAVWAMRKLAAAKKRLAEIADISQAEIDRIQAWAEQQSREPLRDTGYFEAILFEYGASQRAEGRKTVSTPYGAIKSRMGSARYVFADKRQFIDWAREHRPDWLAVKEEPSLSAMRDANVLAPADPETGEVIPGLQVEEPSVSYSLEVDL